MQSALNFEQRCIAVMATDQKVRTSATRPAQPRLSSVTGLSLKEIRAAAMQLRAATMAKAYETTTQSPCSGTGRESVAET